MIEPLLQQLGNTIGVTTHRGIDADVLAQCESSLGFHFPLEHAELLRWSNGVEAYYGFFRLFGIRSLDSVDAVAWNDPGHWKFAWQDRCLPFWCFGETAWGDQYAYAIDSLRDGESARVYFIEGLSMTPEVIAASFAEFLEKEFLRNARVPYEQMSRLAKQKLGSLEIASHLVYVPSVLLGGTEDLNNVQKMNARAAMICNGDIAIQLDAGPPSGSVAGVEPFEDAQHRMRLRLIWK